MGVKKILISEDISDDIIKSYIDAGFKVNVLSKRKINRKDKKKYNRLRNLGLNPEIDFKFSSESDLIRGGGYNGLVNGDNPVIAMLSHLGEDMSKYRVLSSVEINNMEEAERAKELEKDHEMKFIKVKTVYTYELRDQFSGEGKIIDTSRDFCVNIVGMNKAWSLDEIKSISTTHLRLMKLPEDVFTHTGGWYRLPNTTDSVPFCRHVWKSKVVIER